VFSTAFIAKGTHIWAWTRRVNQIHHTKLETYIKDHFFTNDDDDDDTHAHAHANEKAQVENISLIQVFLRQGFVLPNNDAFFNSNPTDAGRFMNHSNEPTCGPDGALRDIEAGEELTMCYSFHGNPQWYQDICIKYGVLSETDIYEGHHV